MRKMDDTKRFYRGMIGEGRSRPDVSGGRSSEKKKGRAEALRHTRRMYRHGVTRATLFVPARARALTGDAKYRYR